MFIGLIIIVVGVLLLLQAVLPDFTVNFNIVWPTILILIPIYQVIKRRKFDWFMAIILFIGVWFLLLNLGIITDVYTDIFWPIIFIIAGLSIILGTLRIKKINRKIQNKVADAYYGIFSGVEETIKTDDFKGTTIYAVFGGVDLDLRDSKVINDIVINVYSVFGGTTLYIPEDYNLEITATSVFGGYDNKTRNTHQEGRKTIYINCISVFGGTEVK